VADRLHDVAGAGLAFGPDHRRPLADTAKRFTEILGTAHEWRRERPLVDVVILVGGGEHLGLVDVVDVECLQHPRFEEVPDAGLRHDRDRHGCLDALDHLRIGHAGDTAVPTNVGRHALECHHGHGAGILGDFGLFGVDDIHDDAALEHVGQTSLDQISASFHSCSFG
jgi:hypothetical protein